MVSMTNTMFIVWLVIAYAAGVLAGIWCYRGMKKDSPDGILNIDTTDEGTDRYKLTVLCPLDELENKKGMYLNITHEKHSV